MAEGDAGDAALGPLAARVPEALRGSARVPRAAAAARDRASSTPTSCRTRCRPSCARGSAPRSPRSRSSAIPIRRRARLRARGRRASSASRGEQLVFGNGSDELIAMLCAAFAGPILYPVPSVRLLPARRDRARPPPVEVPLDVAVRARRGRRSMRAIDAHRPSVVFLALPNNPTGTLWRPAFALELAARHRDIVDRLRRGVRRVQRASPTCRALAAHPNLVVMRTLSKIGMAGLRVGFTVVVARDRRACSRRCARRTTCQRARSARRRVRCSSTRATWCAARAAEVVAERARLAAGARRARARGVPERGEPPARAVPGRAPRPGSGSPTRGIVVRAFGATGPARGLPADHRRHARPRTPPARGAGPTAAWSRSPCRRRRRCRSRSCSCSCSRWPRARRARRGPGSTSTRALAHVERLTAIGPRPGDSEAARAAAAYIEAELAGAGIEVERVPVGVVELPAIVVLGQTLPARPARAHDRSEPGRAVRAPRPGAARDGALRHRARPAPARSTTRRRSACCSSSRACCAAAPPAIR